MWDGKISSILFALGLMIVMEYQPVLLAQLKLAVVALHACGW